MFAARSLKTIYGGSMVLRYTWYFVELDACFTSVHSLHEDNADLTSLRLAVIWWRRTGVSGGHGGRWSMIQA